MGRLAELLFAYQNLNLSSERHPVQVVPPFDVLTGKVHSISRLLEVKRWPDAPVVRIALYPVGCRLHSAGPRFPDGAGSPVRSLQDFHQLIFDLFYVVASARWNDRCAPL